MFVNLHFTQAEERGRGTNKKRLQETERKRSGEGKRETQIENRQSTCTLMCTGILRHALTVTQEA